MPLEINTNTQPQDQPVNLNCPSDVRNAQVNPTSGESSLSSGDSSFCGSVFNTLVTPFVSFLTAVFHLITCEVFRSEAVREPENRRENAAQAAAKAEAQAAARNRQNEIERLGNAAEAAAQAAVKALAAAQEAYAAVFGDQKWQNGEEEYLAATLATLAAARNAAEGNAAEEVRPTSAAEHLAARNRRNEIEELENAAKAALAAAESALAVAQEGFAAAQETFAAVFGKQTVQNAEEEVRPPSDEDYLEAAQAAVEAQAAAQEALVAVAEAEVQAAEAASAARNAAEKVRPTSAEEYRLAAEILAARNPRDENEIEERENAAQEALVAAQEASAARDAAEAVQNAEDIRKAAAEAASAAALAVEEARAAIQEKLKEKLTSDITKSLENVSSIIGDTGLTPSKAAVTNAIEAAKKELSEGPVNLEQLGLAISSLNDSVDELQREEQGNTESPSKPVRDEIDILEDLAKQLGRIFND